jgi:hypothetical protein
MHAGYVAGYQSEVPVSGIFFAVHEVDCVHYMPAGY